MSEKQYFKINDHDFGEKGENDKVPFKFQLRDGMTRDQIYCWRVGCGSCTKAKLIGDTIVGTLDLGKALFNPLPGSNPVSKNITVYFNDGRPIYIGDPKTKEMRTNPEKEMQILTIRGTVKK